MCSPALNVVKNVQSPSWRAAQDGVATGTKELPNRALPQPLPVAIGSS